MTDIWPWPILATEIELKYLSVTVEQSNSQVYEIEDVIMRLKLTQTNPHQSTSICMAQFPLLALFI